MNSEADPTQTGFAHTGRTPERPSPGAMAAQAAQRTSEPGDPADHPVSGAVDELLEEAAMISAVVGDEFDLGAVSRQAQLLTQAHDALSAALEDAR
ncbi:MULTISPECIES: hypothetical protein [Gordonia]|jgi:hypothetical protein|uniref:hypothetical protein n=1 Tax=Gordonia TaxID=2053 RepID=UPI003017382C